MQSFVSLTVVDVHARYGGFVWSTIHRMGIRAPHLDDVYQEVFLVVHRRFDSFSGSSAVTTWLFEICFRVVAGYRRRAYFRREHLVADAGEISGMSAAACSPERQVQRREAAEQLHEVLSELRLDHRVVFTMFELEGLRCEQIGAELGVPVGTVYSRLHRARRSFLRVLAAHRTRPPGARFGSPQVMAQT